MSHSPRALTALLIAVLLSAAVPAAIDAAGRAPHATHVADSPPLNTNLLKNPGFEQVGSGGTIPGWTPTGAVHVETFGTRTWPSKAYAKKYNGGKRYLACGTTAGSVSQTVDISSWNPPGYPVTARLKTNFGGTLGHSLRVSIKITGDHGEPPVTKDKLRVLDISNHYKNAVATVGVPVWATHIQATLELMPKAGAAKCIVVADTVQLFVYNDG